MVLVTLLDGKGDEEVRDSVDDSLTDDEIIEFLDNKYGADVWMAYNKEYE